MRAPNGSTVLMMAAREGHDELARQILDVGADPRAVNRTRGIGTDLGDASRGISLARLVSGQTEFAQAAPDLASFGAPVSVAAPPEIGDPAPDTPGRSGRPADGRAAQDAKLAMVEHFKPEKTHCHRLRPPAAKPRHAANRAP